MSDLEVLIVRLDHFLESCSRESDGWYIFRLGNHERLSKATVDSVISHYVADGWIVEHVDIYIPQLGDYKAFKFCPAAIKE